MTDPAPTSAPRPADGPAGLKVWRSQLTLSSGYQEACQDVLELRRLVTGGFRDPRMVTPRDAPPASGLLYAAQRSDPVRDSGTRRLSAGLPREICVQSPRPPDWSRLLRSGVLTAAAVVPVHQLYRTGDTVQARTVANPVVHDQRTGRNLSVRTRAECGDWLRRQLDRHGLFVEGQDIMMSEGQSLTGLKGRHPIKVIVREMSLTGTVTDSSKFHALLAQGFGKAKAYGCGLLLANPLE